MSPAPGPDFLVVGAQKCGTTTLYEDLRAHPQIHLVEKESAWLLGHDIATAGGAERYRAAFGEYSAGHRTGEVATAYAMLPQVDAVSVAAQALTTVKIIYIVRNPLVRVISQHHHRFSAQLISGDINQAVYEYPQLLDNSRYARQILPWIEAFGRDNVRVLRFEDYMADRLSGSAEVQDFLGVARHRLATPDLAYNTSAAKRVATGRWRGFRKTEVYQKAIRPALPRPVRERVARVLLPRPPSRPSGPSADTRAFLIRELGPEVASLAHLLGTPPWWDLSAVDQFERVWS